MSTIALTDLDLINIRYMQMSQTLNVVNQQIQVNVNTQNNYNTQLENSVNVQNNFNNQLEEGVSAADGFMQKLKNVAGQLFNLENAKKVMDLSDELTRTTAGIDSMNDGAVSTQGLMDRIYASAQNTHTPYLEAADAIAKMGNTAGSAFNSSSELLSFMDQFNKQCVIGGASADEQSTAVENLTQAMASGSFDSGALNEILSTAPGIGSAIEESMGWAEGSLLSYADQGAVTAEVVKNSLLNMAGDTNEKFKSMPVTFAQSMSNLQNGAIRAFQPVLQKLSEITATEQFQEFVNDAIDAMDVLAGVVLNIFDLIGSIGENISDNWSVIEPIVWGAVASLIAYNAVLGIGWLTTLLDIGAKIGHVIASGMQKIALFGLTAAQYGLNAAIAACPVTWLIIAVIILIALFYAAVGAFNELNGTTVSATGLIFGAFATSMAFTWNLIAGFINNIIGAVAEFHNFVAAFVNFFANVFQDPVGAIKKLFIDLLDFIIGIMQQTATLIDTIFGTNFSETFEAARSKLEGVTSKIISEQTVVMKKYNASDYQLLKADYKGTWDNGYTAGAGIENGLSNLFGGRPKKASKSYDEVQRIIDMNGIPGNLTNISEGINNISEGTTNISDSLGVTSEDLKYLRDIAEQDAINRFTTADIKVEMNNSNNISQDTDLDGFINGLTTRVVEALEVVREGV